jgi:hypothetical protein
LCKEFCGVIFFIVCSSGNCIVVLDEDSPTPNSWFLVTENWIFILFHQLLVSAGHQLSLFFEISTWPAIVAFFCTVYFDFSLFFTILICYIK